MSIMATNGKGIEMDYQNSSELKWVFVKKWGKMYVAPAEYPKWIHEFSPTEKKYWRYIPELDVWRCNVSAL